MKVAPRTGIDAAIEIRPYALSRTKRMLDVSIAICALLCVIVILPAAFIAIRLTSRGSGFYRQTRVGKGGNCFTVLKFRTMKVDSDNGGGPSIAYSRDDRKTLVGKMMRKIHLDELPQCINVLKGEMSLVGPRPFIQEECEANSATIETFDLRHQILPGITGLAQVNYDHINTKESAITKLEDDLEYMRRCSLKMDLIIIAKTVIEAFRMRGA